MNFTATLGAAFLPALSLYLGYVQFGWHATTLCAATILCLSLIAHEGAHIAVARINRVKVKKIGFRALGPFIQRERSTKGVDIMISFAGPALNLTLAAMFWGRSPLLHWAAQMNAVLGLSNLLPIKGTDGWNIVTTLLRSRSTRVIAIPVVVEAAAESVERAA